MLISLDGATPRLVEQLRTDGTIPVGKGFALLATHRVQAEQNIAVSPSLTAPGHIAIATKTSAVRKGERMQLLEEASFGIAPVFILVTSNEQAARLSAPVISL